MSGATVIESIASIPSLLAAADAGPATVAGDGSSFWWTMFIPLLPLVAAALCLVQMWVGEKSKLPAWTTVATLAGAFVITLIGFINWQSGFASVTQVIEIYEWIRLSWGEGAGQSFVANFGFYMDGLSWLWMLFVTALATMIALYASEYMQGDPGYPRFFAAFCLFVFSMSCLVMGDNLVLLYLGWEGVGLCSYMLIGYFFRKPEAVAAAKKAFIVNRIGDLGLALGLYLAFTVFGSIEYSEIFRLIDEGIAADGTALSEMWQTWAIPLLLMVGAFGKSAQLPLYVWLPDAMEGPTPVSALIHAATMVTAGVYLVARFFPLFVFPDVPHYALWTVAWVGTLTAFFAATIGMAQYDIKRIMAYSTVSQLGYMFAGLGVLTSAGAVFHVFTHAFFKALLFLACGAVMHGFAGQLDLRRLSGLWSMKGWRIVSVTMLVGCLNLAGFPLITSGYFSKDMILAEAFVTPGGQIIGWILLLTAGMTAYYTFRVFFRVFVGPEHAEPGDDDHGSHDDHADDHAHDEAHADHGHGFHPHAPGWAINTVLVVLAICTFLAIPTYFIQKDDKGWVGSLVHESTAYYHSPYGHHKSDTGDKDAEAVSLAPAQPTTVLIADPPHGAHASEHAHGGTFLGYDPHKAMYYVSAVVGFIGILLAAWFHGPRGIAGLFIGGRTEAATCRMDGVASKLGPLPKWAENKWYVDEFYDLVFVKPLYVLGHIFHMIDKLIVDGIVNLFGSLPRATAGGIRPSQSGVLQSYATGMAVGVGVLLLLVWVVTS
ncbi:MAG: NADH-quinone oxidoreductase subunit L [Planctomycetota bacterium]